jgi:hypothetical protein
MLAEGEVAVMIPAQERLAETVVVAQAHLAQPLKALLEPQTQGEVLALLDTVVKMALLVVLES